MLPPLSRGGGAASSSPYGYQNHNMYDDADAEADEAALRGLSYTGQEFDALAGGGGFSSDEQAAAVDNVVVLSRVEPMHKLRLVEQLRARVRGARVQGFVPCVERGGVELVGGQDGHRMG